MSKLGTPVKLDIASEEFRMNSKEVREARDAHWYAETDWGIAVLSYEDNTHLLHSPYMGQGSAKWPRQHGVSSGQFHEWWSQNLLVLEGDDHHRIRRLVNPAFSRRKVRAMEPKFEELARELIGSWIHRGEVDFASEFASPYATRILCMMLGIDESDWHHIQELASTIGLGLGVHVGDHIASIDAAVNELTVYAEGLITEREAAPTDDLLGTLLGANREDDRSLSRQELVNIVILLIFAGIDTTRHQLSLSIDSFQKQPDQWDKLARHPYHYAERAVEEALRVNPIGRWVTREATESFQHRERWIEEGTTVHLYTLTGGTDPAEFNNPCDIDLDAERSPHFAFGGGVHHCLGHFVARTDIGVALAALAGRITNVRVGADTDWLPDSGNTGASYMPITFERRNSVE